MSKKDTKREMLSSLWNKSQNTRREKSMSCTGQSLFCQLQKRLHPLSSIQARCSEDCLGDTCVNSSMFSPFNNSKQHLQPTLKCLVAILGCRYIYCCLPGQPGLLFMTGWNVYPRWSWLRCGLDLETPQIDVLTRLKQK